MKVNVGLGVFLLGACGGSSGQEARPSTESERADSARGGDSAQEIAGGETSEFSGDISNCPEIVSSTALDLDDPEVASWVALAEGHHEATLGWERGVLSEALTGFEEHTSVSIDVTVLRGREVVYGAGGSTSYELEACSGRRARQLQLDIELATADGAVAAAFQEWFEPEGEGGRTRLRVGALHPDRNAHGMDFTGSLELGLDPALGGTRALAIYIGFDAESVRGSLFPTISPDPANPNRSEWTPLQGNFPDSECNGESTFGLDDVVPSIGVTPRAAFQRAAAVWESDPIPAVWTAAPYGVALPGVEAPPPTEVTLSVGEPTHACMSGDWALVYASLTLATADGLVNLTQPITVELYPGTRASTRVRTPWLPAANFAAQTGLSRADLAAGSYGAVEFHHAMELEEDRLEGELTVFRWEAFSEALAAHPALAWCAGARCGVTPESER